MLATFRNWALDEMPSSRAQAAWGRRYRIWLALRSNPLAMIGLLIVLGLLLVALVAPLLATHSPIAQNLSLRLQPPSAEHWLGTDEFGRDIYSRIIHGTRLTLAVVVLVAILVGPVGLLVGTVAGYMGGWSTRC